MDFHPDKCSTLHVTRSRTPILQDYILKGHKLTSEASSKYLGVELHSDMSWRSHIDKTVKKANSTLGFLRRNLKVSNQNTKTAAYKTLVSPTEAVDSSCLKDTKQGSSATGAGKVFQIMVVCGKNGVCSNLWMLRTVDELVWSGKLLL
jgi:hypothetical protein